jgi:hypothetical protein
MDLLPSASAGVDGSQKGNLRLSRGVRRFIRSRLSASTSLLRARVQVGLENEEAWLRARIIRLRRLLRYVKDAQVEAGLKEFIGDAEARLDKLERKRLRLIDDEPPGG